MRSPIMTEVFKISEDLASVPSDPDGMIKSFAKKFGLITRKGEAPGGKLVAVIKGEEDAPEFLRYENGTFFLSLAEYCTDYKLTPKELVDVIRTGKLKGGDDVRSMIDDISYGRGTHECEPIMTTSGEPLE